MKRLLFSSVLLNALLFTSVASMAEMNKIDMDDVKIKLVGRGDLAVKKITGPDKALLRLKLAKELKSSQKTPELLQPENLEIDEINDTLISTGPGGNDLPGPDDLPGPSDAPDPNGMAIELDQ